MDGWRACGATPVRHWDPSASTYEDPPGDGIFLWCRVPDAVDLDELVRSAREQSILLAKGSMFSPTRTNNQRLRFNVAHSAAPELVRFLADSIRAAA